ncbi:ricin B lectin domain-containing protein [Pholiota molesta]|nr:ricin B lectin domain-containing protein [Pholiota molesta]
MGFFALSSFIAIAVAGARAAIPAAGEFVQLQPTTSGSFPRTPCITVFAAANGSAVVINDCSASTQQRGWNVVGGGGTPTQIQIFNTFCMEVTGDVNQAGSKVEINSCVAGDANQLWQWNADGTVQWAGTDKCLDLTNGDLDNGNQLQISTCVAGDQNQQWTSNALANPANEVVLGSDNSLCMGANSSTNGAPVFITPCSDTTSRKVWTLPQIGHGNSGTYRLAFGPDGTAPVKCLTVAGGVAAAGTKLELSDCVAGDESQFFIPTGTIRWEGTGLADPLCVDLTDGITNAGNQLQISNCTGDSNQIWQDVAPPQTAI